MALLEREMIGEQRGEIKGEIKARENTAMNLIEMGMAFEKIHQATKLSIQRIKELSQKFEDKKEDV